LGDSPAAASGVDRRRSAPPIGPPVAEAITDPRAAPFLSGP
jgi:hypothetical protein